MVYFSTFRQTTGVEETDSVAAERTQHCLKAARLLFELIDVSFQKFKGIPDLAINSLFVFRIVHGVEVLGLVLMQRF